MKKKTYRVQWHEVRSYEHPYPDRTVRIGRLSGEGLLGGVESYTFEVYPTREKMLDAYYKHGRSCGNAPHVCITPLVRV